MSGTPVERVDLGDWRDPNSRDDFRTRLEAGLTETGFVRLVGHGIEDTLVDRAHALFAQFFAQSEEAKLGAGGIAGGQRGFTPFGVEHARDCDEPDLKEFFHVGQELVSEHPLCAVYPPNVWPEAPAALRETALALYRALESAARALLEAIEDAFHLEVGALSGMIVHGNSILRAAHYPPVERTPPGSAELVRAAPHEDINLITLLCGATHAGLELLDRDGAWVEVPARPGEIVADVGDMLARVTNGALPATTHRVVARGRAGRADRYSLPFFAHPRPDCDLSVLPQFVSDEAPPRFAPITAGAFLEERLREIGLIGD